jgi:hypothetical protein
LLPELLELGFEPLDHPGLPVELDQFVVPGLNVLQRIADPPRRAVGGARLASPSRRSGSR